MRRKPPLPCQMTGTQAACDGRSCIPQEGSKYVSSGRLHTRTKPSKKCASFCRRFPSKFKISFLCRIVGQQDCPTANPPAYTSQIKNSFRRIGNIQAAYGYKRHDAGGRWRQVTRLPRPCSQHPPFHPAVRECLWSPAQRIIGGPGITSAGHRPIRLPARAFDVILLTERAGNAFHHAFPRPSAGSHRARAWSACQTARK